MKLPLFLKDLHYDELRGDDPRSKGEYRFQLFGDVVIKIKGLGSKPPASFRDRDGLEWACVSGSCLIIRKGYAWNGATPKKWLLGRWWGTPDFRKTHLATLVHDVCFQFLRTAHFPLDVRQCNSVFLSIMVAQKFRLANVYHGAVTDFGKLFTGEYPKKGEYSTLL